MASQEIVPLVKEIQTQLTACEAFELFKDRPHSFFLDSGVGKFDLGRYSFFGCDPFLIVRSKGQRIEVVEGSGKLSFDGDPFRALKKLLSRYRLKRQPNLPPFLGGAVGYFGYDLCHFVEKLPSRTIDDLNLPDCYLCFYDAVVVFDHLTERVFISSCGFPQDTPRVRQRQELRLAELSERIGRYKLSSYPTCKRGVRGKRIFPLSAKESFFGGRKENIKRKPSGFPFKELRPSNDRFIATELSGHTEAEATARDGKGNGFEEATFDHGSVELQSNFTRQGYLEAVKRVKEYIACGDIFQVNLSQRLSALQFLPPFELYKRLRRINPAPFASFLNFDEVVIVSASPERFLRISGRRVQTRPIKGTRPRGKDPIEDGLLAKELLNSAKDRAELVMIVDLERNDLGRVCDYGSVKVPKLVTLEAYSTVFHLVGCVEGRLYQGKDHIDCLKACFPGGSITGAPKVRAMEIIDQLEPTRRGIYTGSIGYLGFNQETDLNIVIRTMALCGGRIYFQVGGGIVADSEPASEYDETLHKAKALIDALALKEAVYVGVRH